MTTNHLFKNAGYGYHIAAAAYAVSAYTLGLAGLFSAHLFINLMATLLLAHGMTIAAYLIHECGHNTIFTQAAHNARLGNFLSWLCGSCYGTYEDIRYKHFRHHVDNDDVVWFEYSKWFEQHPTALHIIRLLEWMYIPAHDLLMHFIMVFSAFIIPARRYQRLRNAAVIIIRSSLFFMLVWFCPKAIILYPIAYMIMMTILRFMDSLQHDYGYHTTLFSSEEAAPHKRDSAYEQVHTFSNPLSMKYTLPNWLVLNFGFHNAHHSNPTTAWYRLPQLHRELFGEHGGNVIPFSAQLKCFHRYRVARIVEGEATEESLVGVADFLTTARKGQAAGGNAASFLTSF